MMRAGGYPPNVTRLIGLALLLPLAAAAGPQQAPNPAAGQTRVLKALDENWEGKLKGKPLDFAGKVRELTRGGDPVRQSAVLKGLLGEAKTPAERAAIGQALEALGEKETSRRLALELAGAGGGDPKDQKWAAFRLRESDRALADRAFAAASAGGQINADEARSWKLREGSALADPSGGARKLSPNAAASAGVRGGVNTTPAENEVLVETFLALPKSAKAQRLLDILNVEPGPDGVVGFDDFQRAGIGFRKGEERGSDGFGLVRKALLADERGYEQIIVISPSVFEHAQILKGNNKQIGPLMAERFDNLEYRGNYGKRAWNAILSSIEWARGVETAVEVRDELKERGIRTNMHPRYMQRLNFAGRVRNNDASSIPKSATAEYGEYLSQATMLQLFVEKKSAPGQFSNLVQWRIMQEGSLQREMSDPQFKTQIDDIQSSR